MHIKLLYTPDCPAREATWTMLQDTASTLAPMATLEQVCIGNFRQALEQGFGGSPSIQIDGRDLEGPVTSPALTPRTYGPDATVPPLWLLEAAILRAAPPQKGILFLCVANSARSQMAEGIARNLAPAELNILSAGSEPTSLRPEAARVLSSMGIDPSGHFSKSVESVDPELVDTVITLCAEEVCPVFLGKARRIHWGLSDPAAQEGSPADRLGAFFATAKELQRRLGAIWQKDTFEDPKRMERFTFEAGILDAGHTCTGCGCGCGPNDGAGQGY